MKLTTADQIIEALTLLSDAYDLATVVSAAAARRVDLLAKPDVVPDPGTRNREPNDAWYAQAAREQHARKGVCKIDDDAPVARALGLGAYVQAWVWVCREDVIPTADPKTKGPELDAIC